MATYADLIPANLKPCYSDGVNLKPSITTSLYTGGTPTAANQIKRSLIYADGTLKPSIANAVGLKSSLLAYNGATAIDYSVYAQALFTSAPAIVNGEVVDKSTTGSARPQQPGRAKSFDGVDGYIDTGYSGIAGSAARTMWARVKFHTIDVNPRKLFGYGNGQVAGAAFTLTAEDVSGVNHLLFRHGGGNIRYASGIATDQWVDVVLVIPDGATNTSDAKVFVDGIEESGTRNAGSDQTLNTTVADIWVGSSNDATPSYTDGDISQFGYWERELSTSEIAALSNNDFSSASDSEIFYKLEGDVLDSSGNGRDGTISGGVTDYTGGDVPYSYQNEVGYTDDNGTLKPRDESDPTQDVDGNPLQYTGRAPRNGKLIESNCGVLDGANGYISFGQLPVDWDATDWEMSIQVSITSFGPSSNRGVFSNRFVGGGGFSLSVGVIGQWVLETTQSNDISTETVTLDTWYAVSLSKSGRILTCTVDGSVVASLDIGVADVGDSANEFRLGRRGPSSNETFDGSMCDFTLTSSVSLRSPISEGQGITIHDVSGNGNHGTASGGFSWGTQDEYHYNLGNGFRESSGVKIPALADGSNAADGNPITNPAGAYHNNAETKIDFTGGVAAPWVDRIEAAESVTIPTDYEFGDTLPSNISKTVDTNQESAFVMDGERYTATVTIAATTQAAEPSTDGQFTVTLSQQSATDTTISYAVSGTATAGTDYTTLPGSVTILAGSTTATIDVAVSDDATEEAGGETVIVTLSSITSGDAGISIGSPSSATVTISDDDSSISGMEFNGTTGAIDFGTVPYGRAIALWVRPTLAGATASIFDHDNDIYYRLSANDSNYSVRYETGALSGSHGFTSDEWVHVIWQFESVDSRPRMYLDNVYRAQQPTRTELTGSGQFVLGRQQSGSNFFFDGVLRDVRIYANELTADERTYVFTDGASGTDPGATILHAPLTDGTADDISGNGRDGTISGGVTDYTGPGPS